LLPLLRFSFDSHKIYVLDDMIQPSVMSSFSPI